MHKDTLNDWAHDIILTSHGWMAVKNISTQEVANLINDIFELKLKQVSW